MNNLDPNSAPSSAPNSYQAEKIIALEEKMAFLEAANESLSDTLIVQQQLIDQLDRRIELLAQQFAAVEPDNNQLTSQTSLKHEIPPHY